MNIIFGPRNRNVNHQPPHFGPQRDVICVRSIRNHIIIAVLGVLAVIIFEIMYLPIMRGAFAISSWKYAANFVKNWLAWMTAAISICARAGTTKDLSYLLCWFIMTGFMRSVRWIVLVIDESVNSSAWSVVIGALMIVNLMSAHPDNTKSVRVGCATAASVRLVLNYFLWGFPTGMSSMSYDLAEAAAATMAVMQLCLVTTIPSRLNTFLAHAITLARVRVDTLGDPVYHRGSLEGILRVFNRNEHVANAFPVGLTVEQAIFDLNGTAAGPCLFRSLDYFDRDRNVVQAMIDDNRAAVRNIEVATLTEEMKLAIRLYTAEEPVRLCKYIHEPFKRTHRTQGTVLNCLGMMRILIAAIRELSRSNDYLYRGNLYRGECWDGNADLADRWSAHERYFQIGNIIHFAPLASTTKNRAIAETRFCSPTGVHNILYVMENVVGVSIESLSHFGVNNGGNPDHVNEEEVLFCPPSGFSIREKHLEGNILVLYLTKAYISVEERRAFTYWQLPDAEMDASTVG
jgi:hypothetical protein